jgi:hypothetical protein
MSSDINSQPIVGIGGVWRSPYLPLLAYCLVTELEWIFDWFYIRNFPPLIPVGKFAWVKSMNDPLATVKELTARMTIETVEMIECAVLVWASFVSVTIFFRVWSGVPCRTKLTLFVILVLAAGCFWVCGGEFPLHKELASQTDFQPFSRWLIPVDPWTNGTLWMKFGEKVTDLTQRNDFAKHLRHNMTCLSLCWLFIAAFVIGCVLAKPSKSIPELKTQMKYLAYILYSVAAIEVLHVIDLGVFQLRAAALLTEPSQVELVHRMAANITVNAGVTLTCILLAFHLPAVVAVTWEARQILPPTGLFTEEKRSKWLAENEIKATAAHFYLGVAAALSPLLVALPLAKLFLYLLG